jgi:hypothetical protein
MNDSFGSVEARKYSIALFPGHPSIAALHYAVNLSIERARGDKNKRVWVWGGVSASPTNQNFGQTCEKELPGVTYGAL